MSEQNKALVRRGVENVWNGRNLDVIDEVVANDFVIHAASPDKEIHGREGVRQQFAGLRAAFPDLHFMIEDHIAEGDRVVTRWAAQGTHQGTFQGVPATGKRITLTGIDIDRIADGKVVECWMTMDELGLLQQLGVIPQQEAVETA